MKKKQLLIKTIFVLCIFAVISVFPMAVNAAPDDGASAQVITVSTDSKSKKDSSDLVKDILIALGISLAVSGITVVVIACRYKFNGRTEPYPYNRKAALELSASEDVLIHTDIKRERIERDRR